jgi:hypothetical protein
MPLDEYREDFRIDSSLELNEAGAKLDELWDKCACTYEFPALSTRYSEGAGEAHDHRAAAYQRCGRFLVTQSHVVLAIWDGRAPSKAGGTADSVYFKVPRLHPLPDENGAPEVTTAERGCVVHVPTSRASDDGPPRDPGEPDPTLTIVSSTTPWVEWAASADHAARDVNTMNVSLSQAQGKVQKVALSDVSEQREPSLTSCLHSWTDAISTRTQAQYRRAVATVLALGVICVVVMDQTLSSPSWGTLTLQALAISATLSTWIWLTRRHIKDLFEQYRAIAEGARVQEAWAAVGLEDCIVDDFPLGQAAEFEWIRSALRAAWFVDQADRASPSPSGLPSQEDMSRIADMARQWICGQIAYFGHEDSETGAIAKNAISARRYGRLAVAALSIALLAFVPEIAAIVMPQSMSPPLARVLTGLWGLGLAVAAALTAYAEIMVFHQTTRRYRMLLPQYLQGLTALDDPNVSSHAAAVRDLVRQIGRAALNENSDWLVLHVGRHATPI